MMWFRNWIVALGQELRSSLVAGLTFFRLFDKHDGQLSLTNTAMLIALWKFWTLQDFSLTELTVVLTAVGAYVWKTHGRRKIAVTEERIAAVEGALDLAKETATGAASGLAELGEKVTRLANRVAASR